MPATPGTTAIAAAASATRRSSFRSDAPASAASGGKSSRKCRTPSKLMETAMRTRSTPLQIRRKLSIGRRRLSARTMPMTINSRKSGCVVKASIAGAGDVIDAGVCMTRLATYARFWRRWPIGSLHSHGQTANIVTMPVASMIRSFDSARPAKKIPTITGKNTAFVFVASANPHSTPAPRYQRTSSRSHAVK
jgi:hypothetical protein